MGLLNEAMLDAESLIGLQPTNFEGYLLKAKILLERKIYISAHKYVDKAICLGPDKGEPYFLRGEIYTALGKYKQAMIEYNYSIKLDNRDPDFYVALGKVCKKVGYNSIANYNFEQACILDNTYYEKVNKLMSNPIQ